MLSELSSNAGFIQRYLHQTLHYSRPRFIVELTLLAFPLRILVLLPWMALGLEVNSTTEAADRGSLAQFFFLACVAAPLLETILGQWLPIRVMYIFTKRVPLLLIGSALFFSALHLHVGISGVVYTLPVALLLSWSFLVYRRRSRWEAYWVTAAIHGLHNFIALTMYSLAKDAAGTADKL